MEKKSAGILLFRLTNDILEILLVHPGGPFWAKKDLGYWSIPKGEFSEGENPLEAAKREFSEEIGKDVSGNFIELTPIKQKGGKMVYAFAIEGNLDTKDFKSNTFEIEWPPKSGKKQAFPEVDKCEWFGIPEVKQKLLQSQLLIIDELVSKLNLSEKQLSGIVKEKPKEENLSQLDLF